MERQDNTENLWRSNFYQSKMIHEHTKKEIEWIEKKYNLTVSKFMREVLDILDCVYSGLHHTNYYEQFKKSKYCETLFAEYVDRANELSTYDFNRLTKLVVLAHDKGIRVSVSSDRKKGLVICFHNRMGKRHNDHPMNQRHPTLSKAVKQVRSTYTT